MQNKECRKCKSIITYDNMRLRSRNNKTGQYKKIDTICKLCYNEYFRKYLKNSKNHQKVVKSYKDKIHQEINILKLKSGCSKCEYNKNSSALHFHHINPLNKSYEISWGVKHGYNMEKLSPEIKKCEILCSNCHAELENPQCDIDNFKL